MIQNHKFLRLWSYLVLGFASLTLTASCANIGLGEIEEPKYEVISQHDTIELRRYEPMIIAKVETKGERDQAINQGFRALADYIFGNNTTQSSIAMTAPVQQKNSEIAMTAPVQQQQQGESWAVSFVMPSQYTQETIPKPNNPDIQLISVPAKTFATITFSGRSTAQNLDTHQVSLSQFLKDNALQAVGEPTYAFYNPPWIPPMFRRNEILQEIQYTK